MSALLTVAGVTAGYRSMPVLQDVSLEIAEREIVSVVGTNGAGKTTLLLTIAGHIAASAGPCRSPGARSRTFPPMTRSRAGW